MSLRHLCAIFLALLAIQTNTSGFAASKISPQDAYASAMTARAILVDVREKSEIIETGMAELATWLPMSSIESRATSYQEALRQWPKEQKLIFYCRSGRRSEKAADIFAQLGYRTFNAGSFTEWQKSGLPTKSLESQ